MHAVATWIASACLMASFRVRSWAFSAMMRSTDRRAMYSCSKNASIFLDAASSTLRTVGSPAHSVIVRAEVTMTSSPSWA